MASIWKGSSSNYEPLPRFRHISSRVGSNVVVQGGLTKDFSKNGIIHTESGREREREREL